MSEPGTPPPPPQPQPAKASVGRHAVIYAIGQMLNKAVAFLMLPVYTRYLSPADYGVVALVDMTLDVVAMIAGQQIAAGVFRFYHKADSDRDRHAVVSTAMGAMAVSYLVVGTATFLGADALSRLIFDSTEHAVLFRMAAGSLVGQCLLLVPLALARVRDHSRLVVGTNMAKLVLQVGLNVLFIVALGMGVRGVFLSTMISNLVIGLFISSWAIRQVGVGIDRAILRQLLRYGVPLVGMQAATFTMTFADRYFLQAAADEAVVGIYNLAYQFGFLMLLMGFGPVEMVWGPRRFQVAKSADPQPVLAKAFRLINVVIVTFGVGIVLFVADVLRIMTTPPFYPAAALVPVILVAYVLHGWAMLQDIGILVKERTEVSAAVNIVAALVALAAFALLIPRWHAWGAAAATVVAFSTRWALTYIAAQRLWPVRYDWAPVFRLLAVAALVSAAGLAIHPANLVLSIAVHAALFAVYAGLVWNARVLTADERGMIVGEVRSRLARRR